MGVPKSGSGVTASREPRQPGYNSPDGSESIPGIIHPMADGRFP